MQADVERRAASLGSKVLFVSPDPQNELSECQEPVRLLETARILKWLPADMHCMPQVLKVDTSKLTEMGGHAIVAALVDEAGDLYANSGKRSEQHSYSNPYTVEYTMVRAADSGWRISNVLVTGGR